MYWKIHHDAELLLLPTGTYSSKEKKANILKPYSMHLCTFKHEEISFFKKNQHAMKQLS